MPESTSKSQPSPPYRISTVTLRVGRWRELQPHAQAVRTEVFVHEQGIAAELEWDAHDAECLHVVAFDAQRDPIGTARLLPDGHVGRVAVRKAWRGAGLGQRLMLSIEDAAHKQGMSRVVLHAQRSAESFYKRIGYTVVGEPFVEAGIDHIAMQKVLIETHMA